MDYLSRFVESLRGFVRRRRFGFGRLTDGRVSRFVFQSGHIKAGGTRLAHQAFLPPASSTELSVMKSDAVAHADIWKTGNSEARKRNTTLKGCGHLQVDEVLESDRFKMHRMWVELNHKHFRWHADIRGWPDKSQKDARLGIAIELVSKVEFEAVTG